MKKFFKNFSNLPKAYKSLVYIVWLYSIWWFIWNFFINIYIFKVNNNILDVFIYNLVYITASLVWFSLLWFFVAYFRKNIKILYYISFSLFIIAFLSLFIMHWEYKLFLFWILYWIWNWAFWAWLHSQELANIEDKKRDFYSSSVIAWNNVLWIFVPFLISLIFYISTKYFNVSWYMVLFLIVPFLYFISFFYIKNIKDYSPKRIDLNHLKNFFNFKKNLYWLLYIFFTWVSHWISFFLPAVIAIYFLHNEINVWLFEWIISVISILFIMYLANIRNNNNRLKIMFISILLILINAIIFIFNFNTLWYIIYTIIWILLWPLYRISEHVYDLKIMDTLETWSDDFYSAMIYRDFLLWVWRVIIIWFFIFIILNFNISLEYMLKFLILLLAFTLLLSWGSIALYEKFLQNKRINK